MTAPPHDTTLPHDTTPVQEDAALPENSTIAPAEQQRQLYTKLWAVANELRGKMDASDFKNYMLGFLFYRFLSNKFQLALIQELTDDGIITSATELPNVDADTLTAYTQEVKESLGYSIDPGFFYSDIITDIRNNKNILIKTGLALHNVEQSAVTTDAKDDFDGLFTSVDINSKSLGMDAGEREKTLRSILIHLDEVNFGDENTEIDILGDAYEYLIGQFAAGAGKKGGEFYTPQEVATLLAKLVSNTDTGRKEGTPVRVYDPTCGSGSLLLRVKKELPGVSMFTGQELNSTTYNLARMNMLLHGIPFEQFEIINGDTLAKPQHKTQNLFDMVVANPPFSAHWNPDTLATDPRFSYVKTAPKTKADWAFVQHMLHVLKDDGAMAVVLPHGPLFRSASEAEIRTHIVKDKNWLDCVIGLPPNLFYGTSIPAVICVFKKCRTEKDVLFIDASKNFIKGKNQNRLSENNLAHILDVFKNRTTEDKFSTLIPETVLEENGYNLNISRYVDSSAEVEAINITAVNTELERVDAELAENGAKLATLFAELGLDWRV